MPAISHHRVWRIIQRLLSQQSWIYDRPTLPGQLDLCRLQHG